MLEEYFYGYHRDRMHDLRSATKSITGMMAGRMIDEVKEIETDTAVYPMFPQATYPPDSRRGDISVDHLLSMRSGFACDDNNYESPGNEDRMQEQTEVNDWWQYTLAPKAFIAAPLQIDHYYMNLDPMDRGYGGGGMHMRPRDFLKFAQVMLDDGVWNSKKVLPKSWVTQSLQPHASIYADDDYGYTWWRGQLPNGKDLVYVYSATGNGGQLFVIVPSLDLAIGFTGGNFVDFRTWVAWRDKLVPEYLFK